MEILLLMQSGRNKSSAHPWWWHSGFWPDPICFWHNLRVIFFFFKHVLYFFSSEKNPHFFQTQTGFVPVSILSPDLKKALQNFTTFPDYQTSVETLLKVRNISALKKEGGGGIPVSLRMTFFHIINMQNMHEPGSTAIFRHHYIYFQRGFHYL